MTFERSFVNWKEGFCLCCWNAPSAEALRDLFERTGVPFDRILQVEEHGSATLVS